MAWAFFIWRWCHCYFWALLVCLFLHPFESPWYDLRGWLGVKQQLSIYHRNFIPLNIFVQLSVIVQPLAGHAPFFACLNYWLLYYCTCFLLLVLVLVFLEVIAPVVCCFYLSVDHHRCLNHVTCLFSILKQLSS